jgi:16S rRNA (guanine527-N7)-methyltransferase
MNFFNEISLYIENVSRETCEKLEIYNLLLNKWNASYNLVNKNTLRESFSRHFLDSLQLLKIIDGQSTTLDIGSGAGFPGMVLAIVGCKNISLVETNRKKCQFLNEVARQTNTTVNILCQRVEEISGVYEQIIARAFSSLTNLLIIIKNVSRETKIIGYFLKGETLEEEIEEAFKKQWSFSYQKIPSLTRSSSFIVKIWDVEKNEIS